FDDTQIMQIINNLISKVILHNSADASYIQLNLHPYEHRVWTDVRDFGSVIAVHDQALLYKPFFSTSISGTGLGLYLSHSFCEANQAQLNYIQQEQGACFRISCQRITL